MISHRFTNDYTEGCHPLVLEALSNTNMTQQAGYGEDAYTLEATEIIQNLTKHPDAAIHLVAGGTIANLIVLASILKPFESVITAETGHINTHEAGAIEATGHKIESVRTTDGKLRVDDIKPLLDKFPLYHTVRPRVVYISNSTEIGTIYSKKELSDLSEFCKSSNLILYMDGARLASALTADSNDLTLFDIAQLTDVFYIGGTKCGALLGEAIVITNDSLKTDFAYHIKQRGAMMAKGRVLGIQFSTLLKDNLIFDLARHANIMAMKISNAFRLHGYKFLTESDTNQIFPILPYTLIEKLGKKYDFYIWEQVDKQYAAIRLITSWATPTDKVDAFIHDLNELM
ncbi:aminotransferase class I/II-fold pyridoxal phosphate-dependent enzyme [Dysgonomonas sp. OttesenSCG-928-M03]|nr:aminotransferase class I/II-fold pyridoxal phosphate-dependent enzyme [Dysgonomonas sp. OttesenSCG-928-M03]